MFVAERYLLVEAKVGIWSKRLGFYRKVFEGLLVVMREDLGV